MADKLNAGDSFPGLALKLAGGGTAKVPDTSARYQMVLFYRGHW